MKPNKQNKDRKELLEKVERLVEEYAVNWEDWDCLPERLVEFIETHTQKKVEEVIEEIDKKKISLQEISEIREQGYFQDAESAEGYNEIIDEIIDSLHQKFISKEKK